MTAAGRWRHDRNLRLAAVGTNDRILGFMMIGSEAGEVMAAVQTAPWRLRSPQVRTPIGTPKF
jgi:hypothetical protein